MQKSPLKFDDLAFILLFFFMVIAVVSFGQMAENVQTKQETETEEQEHQRVEVFLNANGTLQLEDRTVEPSFFDNSPDTIELSCSPDASWALIQKTLNSLNCEVVLVI